MLCWWFRTIRWSCAPCPVCGRFLEVPSLRDCCGCWAAVADCSWSSTQRRNTINEAEVERFALSSSSLDYTKKTDEWVLVLWLFLKSFILVYCCIAYRMLYTGRRETQQNVYEQHPLPSTSYKILFVALCSIYGLWCYQEKAYIGDRHRRFVICKKTALSL